MIEMMEPLRQPQQRFTIYNVSNAIQGEQKILWFFFIANEQNGNGNSIQNIYSFYYTQYQKVC